MSLPESRLTPQEYMDARVEDQRVWYEAKANHYERQRIRFGVAMAIVTGLTSLASSLDGILLNAEWLTAHVWLVAASTVLMSVSVAITSLASLRSPDFLASSYRATARQIRELQRDWSAGKRYAGPGGFERFAAEIEDIMSREHSTWAKHAFETSRAQPRAVPPTGDGGPTAPPVAGPPQNGPDDEDVGGGNDYPPNS